MQMILKNIFLFLLLASNFVARPQDDIYRITIDGNKVQTGFKLKGINGIVTALHGIAGYNRIIANKINTNKFYSDNLTISKIDIRSDICIISSQQIESIPASEGLSINSTYTNSSLGGATVLVNGFPLGILAVQSTEIKFDHDHPTVELQRYLPPDLAAALGKRHSPETNMTVFDLHGNVAPGHSGAPILFNGEVIGMADGGLQSGQLGYAWAIILRNVEWKNFQASEAYYKLATNTGLFSSEYTPYAHNSMGAATPCPIIEEILKECNNNFSGIIGRPTGPNGIGTVDTYASKVNYLNAKSTYIGTQAAVAGTRVGYISCKLQSEEDRYERDKGPLSNDNTVLLSTSSSGYRRIYQNYILAISMIKDCFGDRIKKIDKIPGNKELGDVFTAIYLKDNDIGITVSISRIRSWDLQISFFNKISLLEQFHP